MNQKELAESLEKEFGLPAKTSEEIVKSILNEIVVELKRNERVRLRNFGTFEIRNAHGKKRVKFNDSENILKAYGKEEK